VTGTGFWLRRAAGAFAIWLVICLVAVIFGQRPHPGLLALVVLAGSLTLTLLLEADTMTSALRWQLPGRDSVGEPGEDPRLALLTRVVSAHLVSREVDDRLRQHLRAIVEARMVDHHGISRQADPERAARLLGPDLDGFLAGTGGPVRLTPAQIDVLIDRIEEL
jgi:hypothetical protein